MSIFVIICIYTSKDKKDGPTNWSGTNVNTIFKVTKKEDVCNFSFVVVVVVGSLFSKGPGH